jgi:hypothetical protein
VPIFTITFRFRRFVNAALFLSFLAAAVSGVVLFLRPEGSLARWTGWTILGLDKQRWETVHTLFVLVVLAASIAHLWLNWRPLVASLLGRISNSSARGWHGFVAWEPVAALGIMMLAWSVAVVEMEPAASINGLRSRIKAGQYAARVMPPVMDADRLTVIELCQAVQLDEHRAVARARLHGIEIPDVSQTISAVAKRHRVAPEVVYAALVTD